MKRFGMCSVMEQNGDYFSNMHYKGAFVYLDNDCLKIRGIFTSDIYFDFVLWYYLPQKAILFKKWDIILCYIENGKKYRYRFRMRPNKRKKIVDILMSYGVKCEQNLSSEW